MRRTISVAASAQASSGCFDSEAMDSAADRARPRSRGSTVSATAGVRRIVDQRELGRRFAGIGRLFVVGHRPFRRRRDRLLAPVRADARTRRLPFAGWRDRLRCAARPAARGARRDQRDETDIGAAADALQHHVADADRRLDAALLQRVAARLIEAGLGEIAKAEQRTRGVAGADEHAVAGEGGDRRIDAFDQALQPLDQRHRAADGFGGRDQDAVAAIGKFEPRAAAGDERAERRAEAAQPLQPDRAVRRQPARELRHLAPVRIRRTESPVGQCCAIGGAEQFGADRIGPQNPRAVDRPQPCGQGARRMHRQSRIADASQLEFRIVHRNDMTGWLGVAR